MSFIHYIWGTESLSGFETPKQAGEVLLLSLSWQPVIIRDGNPAQPLLRLLRNGRWGSAPNLGLRDVRRVGGATGGGKGCVLAIYDRRGAVPGFIGRSECGGGGGAGMSIPLGG
jgi:hypothetical protein